ncbi:MAG: TVP38/TMEM64 family protein, partial [Candidatus Methylomirabilaceae bacterium]
MNQATPANRLTARNRWRVLLLVAMALAVVAVFQFNLLSRAQGALSTALHWLEALGGWAPVVFVLLYIASCVGCMPASILTVGAGVAFGVLTGSIVVSIGATLGASAAFLVGRYLARDWVRRKIGHRPAFIAIDKAVAEEGWKIVFLTRLAPVFPFFLLNY